MGLIHSRASKKAAEAQAKFLKEQTRQLKAERRELKADRREQRAGRLHEEAGAETAVVKPGILGRMAASTERMEASAAARRQRIADRKAS